MCSSLSRFALISSAAALLAGCAARSINAPLTMPQSATTTAHGARGGSWMRPEAKAEDLLYVSNYVNDDVTVVTYPEGELVGTLTGFDTPYGLCVNSTGDVWITSSSQILEYAHGGANPIATLSDPGYMMTGCSVDPTTGNLAVSERPGDIAIYAHASGSPAQYLDRKHNFASFSDCSYDNKGDLFALGINARMPRSRLTELVAGAKTITTIKSPELGSAGGLQWDGRYLAIGGYYDIGQYSISGKTATNVGQTPLKGLGYSGAGGETDFWVQGNTVVVVPFAQYAKKVFLYKYPSGGKHFKEIAGFQSADAVTVSLAQ